MQFTIALILRVLAVAFCTPCSICPWAGPTEVGVKTVSMVRSSVRSKTWCCTLFFGTETRDVVVGRLTALMLRNSGPRGLRYFVFQEELCPLTGRLHIHVYAEFGTRTRLGAVQSKFQQNCHCESRRGSQEQAIAYCKKPETRVDGGASGEWGEMAVQVGVGRPRGSKAFQCGTAVAEGSTIEELREEFPGVCLTHGDKVIDAVLKRMGKRDWPMEILIFVGPTGSGKSTTAKVMFPNAYACPWPAGGRWWMPTYEAQETVVLDEWRGQLSVNQMMKLFDRHAWPDCEAKGRSFQFLSRRVVITTNRDPRMWFQMIPGVKRNENWTGSGGRSGGQAWRHEELDALRRRIVEFAKIYDFAPGHRFPDFVMTERQEEFDFLDAVLPPVHQFNVGADNSQGGGGYRQ